MNKIVIFSSVIFTFIILLTPSLALSVDGVEISNSLFRHPLSEPKNLSNNIGKLNVAKGWYYLPSYDNYAPSGLPDFDQRQDSTWRGSRGWSFCGPVALADILWWFDSKYSSSSGEPGDGIDLYPLVKNYYPPGTPNPGPSSDDHNFNNINDINTPWEKFSYNGELIEQIANCVNINWHKFPFLTLSGVDRFNLAIGARKWITDAGLNDKYKVENLFKPSFDDIVNRVENNQGVILRLGYHISFFGSWFPIFFAHYVAVAGINSDGYIAISDPEWDIINPSSDPTLHNDPSIVSHDVYKIDFNTPYPFLSSWWIPNFERYRRVLVIAAIVISER